MNDPFVNAYFDELRELENAAIFLTDRTDSLEETRSNMVAVGISNSLSKRVSVDALKGFLQRVKANRQKQLESSSLPINLIYYLWVDEMAGQLRLGFINSNHQKLPFSCKYRLASTEEEIINAFLKSPYLEGIPWEDLHENEITQDSDENTTQYILSIYTEEIKRN